MFERVCAILQAIPDSRGRGVSFHRTARRAAALALIGLWAGQAFATIYSCTWVTTTGTTSWFTSASWSTCNSTSPNNSSGNTYDAAIAASGTYTITVSSPVTIGLLTLDATGATLSSSSTITATNGVTLDAGTISGGTIAGTGGPNGTTAVSLSVSGANGTLDNVTLDGSLDVIGQK